jgi:phage terminase large subunit
MLPMVQQFNNYRVLLAEGGRGSAKTQSVGRFLLYLGEKYKLRIVCGRETQATINESVYKTLVDLIKNYNLNYEVQQAKIIHRQTESEFIFKGFREQGSANIKGLEGVDILWIDEAEAITKQTLDVIIPTIRKPKSRILFTMNRFVRDDPVYMYCLSREKVLHIQINYYDNPFCPKVLIDEAEACKKESEQEYNHIWLGEPLENASDYLFNSAKVSKMSKLEPNLDGFTPMKVIGIDFAAKGGDLCVATVLERCSSTQFRVTRVESWGDTEPTTSIGKIVSIIGEERPDCSILDVGGMGTVVHSRLVELGVKIERFDGASTAGVPDDYYNTRAYGYYNLRCYIDNEKILMNNKDVERELLQIRYDYRGDGKRLIMSKEKMRASGVHSPDRADSLMMAVFAIDKVAVAHNPVMIRTTKMWSKR